MKYKMLKGYKDKDFRRLTGVKKGSFEKMVRILKEAESKKKALGGKPNHLNMEDRLLMALERELGIKKELKRRYLEGYRGM